jgi:phosphohistidine phosphatase SixA
MKVLSRKTTGSAIALVGHEPNLGLLAAHLLLGGAARPILKLKKGGVACLRIQGRPASALVRWVLPPALLRRLA